MIRENVTGKLNGIVLTAFQLFCHQRDCQTGGEGIRALVRETDEYKRLAQTTRNGEQSQEENSLNPPNSLN